MKEASYAQSACHFTDIVLHVTTYSLFTNIKSVYRHMESYRQRTSGGLGV